jgi:hypothetical protein
MMMCIINLSRIKATFISCASVVHMKYIALHSLVLCLQMSIMTSGEEQKDFCNITWFSSIKFQSLFIVCFYTKCM